MNNFVNILSSNLLESERVSNNESFYQCLFEQLHYNSNINTPINNSNIVKIDRSEVNWLMSFLHHFLSLRNNRIGSQVHNATYYCKHYRNETCGFILSLKRHVENEFYRINIIRGHSATCSSTSKISEALLLIKMKGIMENDSSITFVNVWSILLTLFPNSLGLKQMIYKKYLQYKQSYPADKDITLKDLAIYSNNLNEDNNGFYCLQCKVNGNIFNSVYTNSNLLGSLSNYSNFCIDGTYKLSFLNFVVIIFGGLNSAGKFRLISISLTNSENIDSYDLIFTFLLSYSANNSIPFSPKAIVSDGAACIKTSISNNFHNIHHINCWAHIIRTIHKKIPSSNPEIKKQLYSDINYLQKAYTKELFNKAIDTIFRKYGEYPHLDNFLIYFRNNCINRNCSWWTGFYLYCSKTNNAIEGFNSSIKRNYSCYRKNHLISLINLLGKVIETKSNESIIHTLTSNDIISYEDRFYPDFNCSVIGNHLTQIHYLISDLNANENGIFCEDRRLRDLLYTESQLESFREYKALLRRVVVIYDASQSPIWESFWCSCICFRSTRKCDHIHYVAIKVVKLSGLEYKIGITQNSGRPRLIPRNAGLRRS